MPVDAAVYPFALAEQRLAPVTASAGAQAAFPSAQVARLDTLLLDATLAGQQASRRQALAEAYPEAWAATLIGIDLGIVEGLVYALPSALLGVASQGIPVEIVEQPDPAGPGEGLTSIVLLIKRI